MTACRTGWATVIARQWPIDGAVAENGAIAFFVTARGLHTQDPVPAPERRKRRHALASLVAEVRAEFPELVPADDVPLRLTDFTFDIGEQERVPRERIALVRAFAEARGASTLASSVHLHLSFDREDKASGAVRLIRALRAVDPSAILARYAFIGDSENDAACFDLVQIRPLVARHQIADLFGELTLVEAALGLT